MSISSPVRRPPPIVLSSSPKPSGIGWYSPKRPLAMLSLRSTSTSSAERGTMLPLSVSSRQVGCSAAASGSVCLSVVVTTASSLALVLEQHWFIVTAPSGLVTYPAAQVGCPIRRIAPTQAGPLSSTGRDVGVLRDDPVRQPHPNIGQ